MNNPNEKTNIHLDQFPTMVKCPAFDDGKCRYIEGGPKELEKEEDCIYYEKLKDENGNEVPSCSYNKEVAVR
jgi:hypothetical protein